MNKNSLEWVNRPVGQQTPSRGGQSVRLGGVNRPTTKDILQKIKDIPDKSGNIKKMKKNSFNYNESNSSDSYEDVIDADSGEKVSMVKTDKTKIYWEMVAWSQERRGFKFLNIKKQFKAFQQARQADITPNRLQERWIEFEKDKFWKEKGFDWMDVYHSFEKRR